MCPYCPRRLTHWIGHENASFCLPAIYEIGEVGLGKCNSGRALIGYHPADGRPRGWLSREIDVVVAGAACGPSGLAEKAPACAAPVVWLWQTSQRRTSAASRNVSSNHGRKNSAVILDQSASGLEASRSSPSLPRSVATAPTTTDSFAIQPTNVLLQPVLDEADREKVTPRADPVIMESHQPALAVRIAAQ